MATPLNILIVEDSPDDAELIVRELRRAGFDPKWKRVETDADFLAGIKTLPQIILSDYSMPQFSGLQAVKLLHESGLDIPFILISGTVGEDTAVEAMKLGATDYLIKDRLARLGPAVTRALLEARERRGRKIAEQQIAIQTRALEASANAIFITDRRGRILWSNPACGTMTGYSAEEMIGQNPRILKSGKHGADFYRNLWETILAGHVWRGEIINRRKDGTFYDEEMTITPVRADDGDISHFIAVKQDITETKKTNASLKLFRTLIDNASDGIEVIDPESGRFLDVNETTCQRLGYTRDELLSMRVMEVDVVGVNSGSWAQHVKTVRQTGFKILEGRHRRKDGSTFPVEVNVRYVKLDRDYLVAAVRDVTKRKQAEQSLRESEEKFRQIAENINEVFWITEPGKHQMLYISPAYEKIWGQTCESLYQSPQNWLTAIHPEDRQRVGEAALTKQELGEYDETYRILRPDGSERWIHDCAFPVRNEAGQIYRIVGVAEDITQNRKLEEQFRQAQKMEAIGQVAGGVAHDFNNILAVIQLQAGMLKADQALSAQQLDYAGEIETAAQRAANLTRQLLLFSRKQAMEPRDLVLNEVVTNIAKMLHRILGEDVQMQFKFSPQPLFIHADAGMIDQILLNLTVNARDAMPKGGQLIVETSAVEIDQTTADQLAPARPGSFACLSVTDTGSGIPPEIISRIFEPFFTTKDVGKGTGLGLATVFGIVQQHQGWINVHSEVGRGSTFRVYLPSLTGTSDTTHIWPSFTNLGGGNETILLVEDESALRASIRTALSRLGYRVLEASTGQEALAVWKHHRNEIRLLLTDLVIPGGMTGKDLAEQLLQQDPKLKIIYASGYSSEIAGKDFLLEEGVNFLAKPFHARKLAQIIRKRLDQSG